MVSKSFLLTNPNGLHFRPAGVFVAAMSKYPCNVTVKFNGNLYNGKSTLILVTAAIKCGSEVEIICDGEEETAALAEAEQLINSGLGE